MNLISTSWSCNGCGDAFICTPSDTELCADCIAASLRETFGAGTRVLSATLTPSVRDMLADAIAYRSAQIANCPDCLNAGQDCPGHQADRGRIEAYRQLAAILTG